MKQRFLIALLLPALVIAGLLSLVALRANPAGPLYSVVSVRAALLHAMHDGTLRGWAGRTIRLRGVIVPVTMLNCTPRCGTPAPGYYISSPDAALFGQGGLWLNAAAPPPWQAWLRRVPWLGSLLPVPHAIQVGNEATYRVRLADLATLAGCGPLWCEAATLLDAT